MADATVADVLDQARAHLGEDRTSPQVFTDTRLTPFFGTAYRKLWDTMMNYDLPRPRKVVYATLAAYTTQLPPSVAGISDFGELVKLEERTAPATFTVSGGTTTNPIGITTSVAHGLATNAEVFAYGINVAPANGRWFITVTGASTFTLNGSVGTGVAPSSGTISVGGERFTEIVEQEILQEDTPAEALRIFEWREDIFQFVGATSNRQLKITFEASGAAPTSGSIGIDNAKDFLAAYAASQAAYTEDRVSEGTRLERLCLGFQGDPGLLHLLINPMVKSQSRVPRQQPAFSGFYRGTRQPHSRPPRLA